VSSGITFLVSAEVTSSIEPELLIIQSLDSDDRLVRPRVNRALRPD
jgi:hypothetical protein